MATFIKTGFWEKRRNPPQGFKGELNLDQLIQTLSPAPSFQQVTDVGNTTTNDIRFNSSGSVYNRISFFRNSDELAGIGVGTAGADYGFLLVKNNNNFKSIGVTGSNSNPYIEFRDGANAIQIAAPSIITGTNLILPTTSGTLAIVNTSAFTGSRVIGGETYTWQDGILISVV